MEGQSRMRLCREPPVNAFLLCTVLAKQTRRLGKTAPGSRHTGIDHDRMEKLRGLRARPGR
jgi:hypothetical protein